MIGLVDFESRSATKQLILSKSKLETPFGSECSCSEFTLSVNSKVGQYEFWSQKDKR